MDKDVICFCQQILIEEQNLFCKIGVQKLGAEIKVRLFDAELSSLTLSLTYGASFSLLDSILDVQCGQSVVRP